MVIKTKVLDDILERASDIREDLEAPCQVKDCNSM